ncbi:pentapeptide repeat-containing protein [Crossiella sp. NPDC003009]
MADNVDVSNSIDGDAANVVQAGNVHGDVIYHGTGRSFIELYQKALDHLDSGRAHTRMAGLRTLGELGQDYPERRQTVVDVMCGYLRSTSEEDDPAELEVRRTAQDLLAEHLRPLRDQEGKPQNVAFWEGMKVNLYGATLGELRFDYCEFSEANFEKAHFIGSTGFPGARFLGQARFVEAVFGGWWVDFESARFEGTTCFRWAKFKVNALFQRSVFMQNAEFSRAEFYQDAVFSDVHVGNMGWLTHIRFHRMARFHRAYFEWANFIHVDFEGQADFRGTRFNRGTPGCVDVRYESDLGANIAHHWPDGWQADDLRELPPANERALPNWW